MNKVTKFLLLSFMTAIMLVLGGCDDDVDPREYLSFSPESKILPPSTILEGSSFILGIEFVGSHDLVYDPDAISDLTNDELFNLPLKLEFIANEQGWKVEARTNAEIGNTFPVSCAAFGDGMKCSVQFTPGELGITERKQLEDTTDNLGILYWVLTAPLVQEETIGGGPFGDAIEIANIDPEPVPRTFRFELDVRSLDGVLPSDADVSPTILETEETTVGVIPAGISASISAVAQQGFPYIQRIGLRAKGNVMTDPYKVVFGVAFPAEKMIPSDTIPFFAADELVDVQSNLLGDQPLGGYVGQHVSDIWNLVEASEDCSNSLPVPEAGYCWKFYSANMRELSTDTTTGKNNGLVPFSAVTDLPFEVKDGAGAGTLYYMWGVTGAQDAVDQFGNRLNGFPPTLIWDVNSLTQSSFNSNHLDALCENSLLPQEVFIGQKISTAIRMRNPAGHAPWEANTFGLVPVVSGAFPDQWDGEDFIALTNAVSGSGDFEFENIELTAPASLGESVIGYRLAKKEGNTITPFGETCTSHVFVTDRVLPGWRVAYSGNGYAGLATGGITPLGAELTLAQNNGVVSDPITIPTTGKYRAEVKGSCAVGGLDITLSRGTAGALQHKASERIFSREVTLDAGTSVEMMVKSRAGDCTIDNAALYRIDLEDGEAPKTTFFTPTSTGAGCCAENSCWSGNQCVASGTFAEGLEGIACFEGEWILAEKRESPYGLEEGYCIEPSSCFKDSVNKCVSSGHNFTDTDGHDHYCQDGQWTSRTKYLYEQLHLLGATLSPNDFTVACGKSADVLNEVEPNLLPSSAQYVWNEVMKCTETGCANANAVCVLSTPTTRVIGTSLNNAIDKTYSFATGGSVLYAFGKPPNYCASAAAQNDNQFHACNGNDVYYDATANLVLLSPQPFNLGPSITTRGDVSSAVLPLKMAEFLAFTNGLETYFRDASVSYGEELYGFTQKFSHFDKVYFAKRGARSVFGVWDGHARELPGDIVTASEPTDALLVQYSGFTQDVCAFMEIPSAAEECSRDRVNPSSGKNCCFKEGSKYYIISQGVRSVAKEEAASPEIPLEILRESPTPFVMFKFFPDLTWKLRLLG